MEAEDGEEEVLVRVGGVGFGGDVGVGAGDGVRVVGVCFGEVLWKISVRGGGGGAGCKQHAR